MASNPPRFAFALIVVQLGLILTALYLFRVAEDFGFSRLLPLIGGGFLLYAALPNRFRPLLFLLLSLTGLGLVLGLIAALALIACALCFIGACQLPIRWRWRIAIIVGLTAPAVFWQAVEGASPLPPLIWPILGSMFMFRLPLYIHARITKGDTAPVPFTQQLNYFFLLPNVCFPLFPMIDYGVFSRTWYGRDATGIYQKGLQWMMRGLIQILLYRALYHFVVLDEPDVDHLAEVALFSATAYLLYLRISGQFHLIIGILCLFGYDLPSTHFRYLMATGFNDLWRRINIYWKDFMVKLFYYPVYFKVRRWGLVPGTIITTFIVIGCTWMLHSWQWFWLRGTFPVRLMDGLFWSLFAVCMAINAVLQLRRKPTKTLSGESPGWRPAVIASAQGVGMFVFMALLWSFVVSPSVGEWLSLMARGAVVKPGDLPLVLGALAGLFCVFLAIHRFASGRREENPAFARSCAMTLPGALLAVLMGLEPVSNRLGAPAGDVIRSLRNNRLNQKDQLRQERGYYEEVQGMNRYLGQLWMKQLQPPAGWNDSSAFLENDFGNAADFMWRLKPNVETVFKRGRLTTNRWGMRDRDYDKEKPPGAFRVAVLGGSGAMGAGVDDGVNFESKVEDRLNRDHAGGRFATYEWLNFSVSGFDLIRRIGILQQTGLGFEPDVAILISVGLKDSHKMIDQLSKQVRNGQPLPYPFLEEIQGKTGIETGMTESEIRRRLMPHRWSLMEQAYRYLTELCRSHGVKPVWAFMPVTSRPTDRQALARARQLAEECGFITLSMDGAFDGIASDRLSIARWDGHPNALAHQQLADRLYEELLRLDDDLEMGLSP